ncbi:MAG: SpoIIIAH-like family protein [Candidatus Pristimantibacillus sp.]
MNTKRQTIWLVSMLSLMVVLSAYYLFTQDSGSEDLLTDSSQTEKGASPSNAAEVTAGGNQMIIDEVQQPDNSAISPADEQVLEQVEAQGGVSSVFAELESKRTEQYNEETDKFYAVIADTQDTNPEESTAAWKEITLLEEKNLKLTNIETELLKDYHNAIIDEENNRYKVLVESEKMEKSQAAEIIDLVMKSLDVNADQVSVQFVP